MSFKYYRDIEDSPIKESDYLKLHNKQLSQRILGLPKGGLVLLSGLRGQGKSTLLGQMKLDLIDNGYKGLEFSLEMTNKKTKQWTTLQACGKRNLKAEKTSNDKLYYSPKSDYIKQQIVDWIGDKIEIDDNETFNAKKIEQQIVERLTRAKDIDFCIIDNMMRMDIADYGSDKLLAQIKFAKTIVDICQKQNICLILVIHPTKNYGIARIDSLAGAGEILNLASLIFILHKVNMDFKVNQEKVFKFPATSPFLQYDTILEIAKDRDFGQDDTLIGMYFEEESKRFVEYKGQEIHYGWEKMGKQESISIDTMRLVESTDDDLGF